MIPGIEILNERFVSDVCPIGIFILFIILLFGAFFASLCLAVWTYDMHEIFIFIMSIIFIIATITLGAIGIYKQINPNTYTEYKVIISDDVSWNEFNEKYEVIDQEGKIYTIKEKTEGG